MQTAKATLHAVVCRRGRATSLAPMPNAQAKAIMTDKAKILRQCKACFSHALVIARFNTVAWRSHCQRAASGLLEVQRACRSVCRVPGVLCTAKATEGSQHLRLSCTDTWPSSENDPTGAATERDVPPPTQPPTARAGTRGAPKGLCYALLQRGIFASYYFRF